MSIRALIIILIVALAAFSLAQGISTLNPLNIEWMLQGDYANHLTGWLFYKNGEWRWPLTYFDGLIYPYGSTTVQMDSIPLVALIFKLLLRYYEGDFQYFGLWIFLSFFLNGWYSFKIFQILKLPQDKALLGALFFIFSPILMWRLGHVALTAHWLILALFYEAIMMSSLKKLNLSRILLYVFIASGVHPYLLAMVFALSIGLLIDFYWITQRRLYVLGSFLGLFLCGAFVSLLWGYFTIRSPATFGFGDHNVDFLGFINSMGSSAILPGLRMKAGQSEAYCYLGLPGILGVVVLLKNFKKEHLPSKIRKWASSFPGTLAMIFLMLLFSLASPLRFGGNDILHLDWAYQLLGPLPGIFRATGRFVWPIYYALLLGLLGYFLNKARNKKVWGLCLILFGIEFFPGFWARAPVRESEKRNQLKSASLKPLSDSPFKKGEIVHLYPKFHEYVSDDCRPEQGFTKDEFLELALPIARKGARISSGSTSRLHEEVVETCRHFEEFLKSRRGSSEWVVLHPNYWGRKELAEIESDDCAPIGKYKICRL